VLKLRRCIHRSGVLRRRAFRGDSRCPKRRLMRIVFTSIDKRLATRLPLHASNSECFNRMSRYGLSHQRSCRLIDNLLIYACLRSAPSFLVRRTNKIVVIATIQQEGYRHRLQGSVLIPRSLCTPRVSKVLELGYTEERGSAIILQHAPHENQLGGYRQGVTLR
jgi:hypothetical protein